MPQDKDTSPLKSRKPSNKPVLSIPEIDRLAERLAAILEYDTTSVSLLMLLLDHLDRTRLDMVDFSMALFAIKQKLFTGTTASEAAQKRFETEAVAKRGTLLRFPKT